MKKYQNIKLDILFGLIFSFFFSSLGFSDTIVLKSGKVIEGEITEKTDDFIKINIEGVLVTFYNIEVESVIESEESGEILLDEDLVKYSDESWLEGPKGYREAQDIQKKTNALIFSYIGTDLCNSSKVFEEEILGSSYFKENSKDIIKVKFHVDLSNNDERVTRGFLCKDYPLLYVTYLDRKFRIYKKYNKVDGKWVFKKPQEFISEILKIKVFLEKNADLDVNSRQ